MDQTPFSDLIPAANSHPADNAGNPFNDLIPGNQKPQPRGVSDVAKDIGKSAYSGLRLGAYGIAGTPGLVAELGAKGIDYAARKASEAIGLDYQSPRENPKNLSGLITGENNKKEPLLGFNLPTPQDFADYDAKQPGVLAGPLYEPQTTAGKYARTIGEFAPGLIAPGGIVGNAIKNVALPAIASETAGQLTEGSPYEPYARAGAAIATGGATALLSRPSGAADVIRQRIQAGEITANDINAARGLIHDAQARGVRLTWPEAIEQVKPGSNLTGLQRTLEGAPQSSPRMSAFMADRPADVNRAVGNELPNIGPRTASPSNIGPNAGREAEAALNDARGAINRASEPYYTASATVQLTPAEMQRVRALPGYAEARDAVRNDPQLARYVAGLPENSVGFLNEVKKYLDAAAENASSAVNAQKNMQRSAGYGSDAAAVKNAAVNASPDYQRALEIQSLARERYLQPLLDGPLGKIAGQDTKTRDAINALFPANPLPNSQREISRTVQVVGRNRPAVAEQLVRAHIESVFNESAQNLQSGANQMGGAKFASTLTGNPQQRANLEAAVRALPNGSARWNGFNRLLEILEATGKRQNVGSRTAFNVEELKSLESGGAIGNVAKTAASPGKWLSLINDRWSRYQLGSNLDELARIITDPQSGPLLARLASMPSDSSRAAAAVGRLLYLGGQPAQTVKPSNDVGR